MVYICLHVHTLLLKFLAVAYQGSFRLKVPTTCGSRQTALWGCRLIFLEQVIFQDGSNFDLGTPTNSATKSPQKLTQECVGVTSVNAWFSELPDDCFLFHWQVLLSPWLQLLLAYHIIVSVWLVQLALKLFTVPSVSSFSSCLHFSMGYGGYAQNCFSLTITNWGDECLSEAVWPNMDYTIPGTAWNDVFFVRNMLMSN